MDTDLLITHMPPLNMHDLAYEPHSRRNDRCDLCGTYHSRYSHWGSRSLLERVQQVRPMVHVFGHTHDSHGYTVKQGTVYINAAVKISRQPIFFDIELDASRSDEGVKAPGRLVGESVASVVPPAPPTSSPRLVYREVLGSLPVLAAST